VIILLCVSFVCIDMLAFSVQRTGENMTRVCLQNRMDGGNKCSRIFFLLSPLLLLLFFFVASRPSHFSLESRHRFHSTNKCMHVSTYAMKNKYSSDYCYHIVHGLEIFFFRSLLLSFASIKNLNSFLLRFVFFSSSSSSSSSSFCCRLFFCSSAYCQSI
jgi:hypothetical protein